MERVKGEPDTLQAGTGSLRPTKPQPASFPWGLRGWGRARACAGLEALVPAPLPEGMVLPGVNHHGALSQRNPQTLRCQHFRECEDPSPHCPGLPAPPS